MNHIQNILQKIGEFASWSALVLILLVTIDVIMRYALGTSYLWLVELETYFFAMIFLLGSALCYQYDQHVRVDIFYEKLSKRNKAIINLLGNIFLLLPWVAIILYFSYDYMLLSLKVNESSAQPNGLPAVWLLKGTIFIGFFLLLIQLLLSMLKQLEIILHTNNEKS